MSYNVVKTCKSFRLYVFVTSLTERQPDSQPDVFAFACEDGSECDSFKRPVQTQPEGLLNAQLPSLTSANRLPYLRHQASVCWAFILPQAHHTLCLSEDSKTRRVAHVMAQLTACMMDKLCSTGKL